jgi:hypothetical protein
VFALRVPAAVLPLRHWPSGGAPTRGLSASSSASSKGLRTMRTWMPYSACRAAVCSSPAVMMMTGNSGALLRSYHLRAETGKKTTKQVADVGVIVHQEHPGQVPGKCHGAAKAKGVCRERPPKSIRLRGGQASHARVSTLGPSTRTAHN